MTGPVAEFICIHVRQYGTEDTFTKFKWTWVDDDHFQDLIKRYTDARAELLDWIAWDEYGKTK